MKAKTEIYQQLINVLFGIYLGLAPVYWLPGVDSGHLALGKYCLIITAMICVWSLAFNKRLVTFPSGLAGPVGLLCIVLSCFCGFFQSELTDVLKRIVDFLMGFSLIWTFFVYMKLRGKLQLIFLLSSSIIAILSLLTITNYIFNFPILYAPAIFDHKPLWMAGFGAERTGWSNGICFYPAVFLAFLSTTKKNLQKCLLPYVLFTVLILSSQIIVGGRAGLLASLLSIFIILPSLFPKKYFALLILLLVSIPLNFPHYFINHLRINRLAGEQHISLAVLDNFSTGRINTYVMSLDLIKEKPLLGYGLEKIDFTSYGAKDVHNVWLKMSLESGLLYPTTFLMFVITLFLSIKNLLSHNHQMTVNASTSWQIKREKIYYVFMLSIILSGILLTFLEPKMLIGSFQPSAYWWAASGLTMAACSSQKRTLGSSQRYM